MNREILFRGKRIDNGEWVQGYYAKKVRYEENYPLDDLYRKRAFKVDIIITTLQYGISYFEVDPKTVGQFTNLHDKNGTKIFDGDILKVDTEFENSTIHRVIWGGSYPAFEIEPNPYDDCNGLQYVAHVCENTTCQIIGNIHDNPDLLKGTNDQKNII